MQTLKALTIVTGVIWFASGQPAPAQVNMQYTVNTPVSTQASMVAKSVASLAVNIMGGAPMRPPLRRPGTGDMVFPAIP